MRLLWALSFGGSRAGGEFRNTRRRGHSPDFRDFPEARGGKEVTSCEVLAGRCGPWKPIVHNVYYNLDIIFQIVPRQRVLVWMFGVIVIIGPWRIGSK